MADTNTDPPTLTAEQIYALKHEKIDLNMKDRWSPADYKRNDEINRLLRGAR